MNLEIKIISKDETIYTKVFDSIILAVDGVNNFFTKLTGKARYNFDKTLFELLTINQFSNHLRGDGIKVCGNIIDSELSTINVRVITDVLESQPQKICVVIYNGNFESILNSAMYRKYHIVHNLVCTADDISSKITEYILNKQYLYDVIDFDASVKKILIEDRDTVPNILELEELAREHGVIMSYDKQYKASFDVLERYGSQYDINFKGLNFDEIAKALKLKID